MQRFGFNIQFLPVGVPQTLIVFNFLPKKTNTYTKSYKQKKHTTIQQFGFLILHSFPYPYQVINPPSRSTPSIPLMSIAPHPFTCRLRRLKHTPNHIKQKRPTTMQQFGFNTSFLPVPLPCQVLNPFHSLRMSKGVADMCSKVPHKVRAAPPFLIKSCNNCTLSM